MRIGYNPNKDRMLEQVSYSHHIIIPVHIPNLDGYFQDAIKVLEVSLLSIKNTSHKKTFISVVNNGSCDEVAQYLDSLKGENIVQEVLHTGPIGKLNAILKGVIGRNFPLVTITDADILFKPGWQGATVEVFNSFRKSGMVGLIPQYNMFSNLSTTLIFDTFFNKNARFIKVREPEEMRKFYQSLGWKMERDHNYLNYAPALTGENGITAYFGSSHVVATYRGEMFRKLPRYFKFSMGGNSERYLDRLAQEHGLWKLTTLHNFAYHMGNIWEDWMKVPPIQKNTECQAKICYLPEKNNFIYYLKNKVFKKFLNTRMGNYMFLRHKKVPKNEMNLFLETKY